MFEKINELLDVFLNNKNLKNTKERDLIESIWEEKINSDIKKNTTILSFKNGILLVKAKNPTWKMELSLIKNKLKKKLTTRKKQ
tara:strand:- start:928 stop:1179 length:252 start_codon:yes stop_codon:yes gene_type:complete